MFQLYLTKLTNLKSKGNHKTVCGALLNHSTLSYFLTESFQISMLSQSTMVQFNINVFDQSQVNGDIINGCGPLFESLNIILLESTR